MNAAVDTVFLFDVDNTLLDNDRIRDDLMERLRAAHGDRVCARYWEIMDELWGKLGYMDYLGALERLRLEDPYDLTIFRTANWLLDYPFADRLYPHALDAVKHVHQWGSVVILSDGDAIFQPRKILRSGLWDAFDGNVLVYVPQGERTQRRGASLSRRPLRADRRQGPHSRCGQTRLGRSRPRSNLSCKAGASMQSRSHRETPLLSTGRSVRLANY